MTEFLKYLEIAGFITGIAGVWLTLRQNMWCFPVGLINVTISFFLFIRENLYADAIQQLFYVVLLSYGWYVWFRPTGAPPLPVTRLQRKYLPHLFVAIFVCTSTLGGILYSFTNASLPFIDASATSTAFAAQYLVAKKKLENWILWIVVNVAYTGIYYYKELPLYVILSIIYLALAVGGYRAWKTEVAE